MGKRTPSCFFRRTKASRSKTSIQRNTRGLQHTSALKNKAGVRTDEEGGKGNRKVILKRSSEL